MSRLSLAYTLASLLLGATATAQPRSKADERFETGRKLMEAGKFDEACAAFEDSQQLDPAVTTLLNLGACREKAGELASAVDVFRAAMRAAQQDGSGQSKELADIAAGHVKRLEAHVPTLTIMVAREQRIDGLVIERNGVRVEQNQWDLPIQLDGGSYKIAAHAPGHEPWSTKIKLKRENDTKTIYLPDLAESATKQDETPTPDEPTPTTTTSSGHSLVWPIAFGVGALAAGGTAFYFSQRGDDLYAQSRNEPDPDKQDSLWRRANTQRYVAEGLAVTGIAFAAVSITLFVRSGSSSAPAVQPTVSKDGAGVSVFGSF